MEVGAINSQTNAYILPSKAQKGIEYKCADCNQKVILRKGTIRKHHFAHSNVSNCQYFEHPNESQQHKDAKLKLAERLKQHFKIELNNNCPECSANPAALEDYKYTYNDDDEVVIEYRDPKNKYVADIAVLNKNKVKAIFEIKHTHETTTDVRPEPWYEITTAEIFEEENRLVNGDTTDVFDKDVYYLHCMRKSRNRFCINCRICYEPWALNIPMLSKKNGKEAMWKQNGACIICKTVQYNPQWIRGHRQICQMCVASDYDKLKEMYDKPVLKIKEMYIKPMFID